MSEVKDVSIVLTKPAGLDGAFADQTLNNFEVVNSFDQVQGTWVVFAPPFFGYERHILKNLLFAAESNDADVAVGAIKGPWVPTSVEPTAFTEAHSQIPSTHVMFRSSWLMQQTDLPDDFVIATGEVHSVREFVEQSLIAANLEPDLDRYVKQDPKFIRPAEVDLLQGDYSKAKEKLGWAPRVTFPQLVNMMVENDLILEAREN